MRRKLYDFIEECLKKNTKKPILSEKLGDRWYSTTSEEILEEVNNRVKIFFSMGVEEGAKTALFMKEGKEWIVNLISLLKAGSTVIPLSPSVPKDDVERILDDVEADFVVVDEGSQKLCNAILNRTYIKKLICSKRGLFEERPVNPSKPTSQDPELEDVPVIIYTSGTTGTLKGAMLTDDNLIYCSREIWNEGGFTGEEKTLAVLPFCHAYGFTCTLLSMLYGGVHIYLSSGVRNLKNELERVKPSLFMGVPIIYQKIKEASERNLTKTFGKILKKTGMAKMLLKKKICSLFQEGGYLYSGGAPIDRETVEFFEELGLHLLNGYGLTETSPVVSMETKENRKIGSVGKPLRGTEIAIDSADEEGVGEIVVKGPGVMKGYYRKKQETMKVLKNGWFHTGDLGRLDNEGFLFVIGRRKNIIVTPEGKNVSPEEIESMISKSPFIEEVMVKGEDEHGRPIITAVLRPNMELIKAFLKEVDHSVILQVLRDEVKNLTSHLPPYKRVRKVILRMEEFPKTYTNKIKRHEV